MIVIVLDKLLEYQFTPPTTAPFFSDENCYVLESSDFDDDLDVTSLLQNLHDNNALDTIIMHLSSALTSAHRDS
eukprot:IDg19019t1